MPFKSPEQEMAIKMKDPALWKKWVNKYGHATGWFAYLEKNRKGKSNGKKEKKAKTRP